MLTVITTVGAKAANYNLCTLAAVKAELEITATTWDGWFSGAAGQPGAIAQVSKAIRRYCSRIFHVEALTDTIYFDRGPHGREMPGSGELLQLSRYPLVAVNSVTVLTGVGQTQTLVAGTDFVVDAVHGRLLRLNAATGLITQWKQVQVTVTYVAGMGAVTTEDFTPSSGTLSYAVQNAAAFSIDQGVVYAGSGAALAAIASGTPAQGQYLVAPATGTYTFSAADEGSALAVSYGYNQIEEDLAFAALRWLTGRFNEEARDPALMRIDQPGGVGMKQYWVPATAQGAAVPPEIRDLLACYRAPVLA